MPLRFLKQNKKFLDGPEQNDYLRHLALALLENLENRDKMAQNLIGQNKNIAKRLADLSTDHKDPRYFFDPESSLKRHFSLDKLPIV